MLLSLKNRKAVRSKMNSKDLFVIDENNRTSVNEQKRVVRKKSDTEKEEEKNKTTF